MCGICGIASAQTVREDQLIKVNQMNALLSHRGPNGEGHYRDGQVSLAMRRLSVIDLNGGWQPLYNEDQSLVLLVNGEIYNYVELRRELSAAGHQFRTNGDCETIVHLYEDYGLDYVHHLRGMYAMALYDRKRQRLILTRDRMGEKPLYLWQNHEQLIFASELKALLCSIPESPKLDPMAVDLYFHYGYIPEPYSAVLNIRKLPAAHYLCIDLKTWHLEECQYWSMEDAPPLEGDPTKAIRAELDTISPNHPPNDERSEAKALADFLKIPFHDIEIDTDQMVEFFPELVYHTDDPIADPAGYGYYMISHLAQQKGVPVLLQGQGADELFWGYSWVKQAAKASILKQQLYERAAQPYGRRPLINNPLTLRQIKDNINRFLNSSPSLGSTQGIFADTLRFMDDHLDFQVAEKYTPDLYSFAIASTLPKRNAYNLFTAPQPWSNVPVMMTRLIAQTYLLENGIAQGDRLSMASSVELRLPFVDYRLVEIIIGFRKTIDDYTFPNKAWLKAALQGILPDWVLRRQKKGFAPPVRHWYAALLKHYGKQLVDGALVQAGILNAEAARKLANGEGLEEGIIPLPFKALCLETWCRKMLA